MAILSPTIRRSLNQVLAQASSRPLNKNVTTSKLSLAALRGRPTVVTSSQRAIHSTSVVAGDALDMADTFSRRHGEYLIIFCCVGLWCLICAYHMLYPDVVTCATSYYHKITANCKSPTPTHDFSLSPLSYSRAQ